MFDPHRTRRSDRRYYTRKGQVLQASCVNTQPIIDQRLVPVYKNYLIQNGLAHDSPPQPPPVPITPIEISGISVNSQQYIWNSFTKYTTPTVNLHASTTQAQTRVIIVFYKDTGGNHFCEIKYLGRSSTYDKTIEDNVECYFLVTSHAYEVTDQNQLDSYEKGLLNPLADYHVIQFYGSTLGVKNDIPLTTV